MDILELERRAAQPGAQLPQGLTLGEQMLFYTLEGLYHNFRSGAINREQGAREKRRILDAYRQVQFQEELWEDTQKRRRRISREIGSLYMCACPHCRKLASIMDGIERTDLPEDVKELQRTIERMRELSAKSGNRATELRHLLDRIKFCIEGERTLEGKIEYINEILQEV